MGNCWANIPVHDILLAAEYATVKQSELKGISIRCTCTRCIHVYLLDSVTGCLRQGTVFGFIAFADVNELLMTNDSMHDRRQMLMLCRNYITN